jgi:hypothetical protein
MTPTGLIKREPTKFTDLGYKERSDLQARFRDKIDALGGKGDEKLLADEELLVISEEFCNWEDSKRRIDLLAIDRVGRLVVIELKRTDDGGHMDLQALRYAAMVRSMVFSEVVEAYSEYRAKRYPDEADFDARAELEEFLGGDLGVEPVVDTQVRIILVAADFGKEITTTVLWLNDFEGMDIRCVRLVPYEVDGKILVDITEVIPLPEAREYIVRVRHKEAAQAHGHGAGGGRDLTKYQVVVDGAALPAQAKRHAIRILVEQLHHQKVALADIKHLLAARQMRVVDGCRAPGEEVWEALVAAEPDIRRHRWFVDYPFVDEAAGKTYVLTNQWGMSTEPTMQALVKAFPEADVTFRAAETADE